VILAHNHLSGSTEPSQADLDATRSVAAGLRVIQVELLDHLILADADFLSLRQSGFLDWNNL
jgi:DNA repair protein RadC